MPSRPTTLNSPLLLGFDRLERILEHVSKSAHEGYPPYNIEQVGEYSLRITVAVAGFALEDLSLAVEDNQLTIRGRKGDDDAGRVYLYRGIAARQFQRAFVLAEGMEVVDASLHNGLLHINLRQRIAEPAMRTIPINKGPAPAPGKTPDMTPGNTNQPDPPSSTPDQSPSGAESEIQIAQSAARRRKSLT